MSLKLTWTCDDCGAAFEKDARDPKFLSTPKGWVATRVSESAWRYACPTCADTAPTRPTAGRGSEEGDG